jgi:hypothetical protein
VRAGTRLTDLPSSWWRSTPWRQLPPTSAARMVISARGTPRIDAEKEEDRPPNQERRGREPQRPFGVRGECGCHEHRRTDHNDYSSRHGYPSQVAGMASSHGSLVRWHRAAEYYRTVNPALLPLRKAPERVCAIHRATMTRLTRPDSPRLLPRLLPTGQPDPRGADLLHPEAGGQWPSVTPGLTGRCACDTSSSCNGLDHLKLTSRRSSLWKTG